MVEISRNRRRCLLALLMSGVVVFAWSFWRTSLSPAERELVGVWRAVKTKRTPSLRMELATDRRFRWADASGEPSWVGLWSVEGDVLMVALFPKDLSLFQRMQLSVDRLLRRPRPQVSTEMTIRRISLDSVETDGGLSFVPVVWRRETSELPSTATSAPLEAENHP